MMPFINIDLIFSKQLKPINDAKFFFAEFFQNISITKKYNSGTQIYDFNTKKLYYFHETELLILDQFMKSCYDQSWKKDIQFDQEWIYEVEKTISSILFSKDKKSKNLRFFFSMVFRNNPNFQEIGKEILQIFLRSIKELFIYKEDKEIGLECSWFYFEFGRLFSDFYIDNSFNMIDEDFFIQVEKIFDNINSLESNVIAFNKQIHNSLVTLFNKKFNCFFNENHGSSIEHFFTKMLCHRSNKYKGKLSIQFAEYSSIFLNLLLEKFFSQKNVTKDLKTYKYFFPKGINSELSFTLNSILPSICNETIDNSIYQSNDFDFNRKLRFKNSFIHKNKSLNSFLTETTIDFLKKLKKNNSFRINDEFLLFLIQIFESKNDSFFIELFNIDIISILDELKNDELKKNIIDWVFDFETTEKFNDFFIEKSVFLKKLINTIHSKKITIINVIKQACIMICFEKFHYDWFMDSRGRLYTESNVLSVQGSNLARLLISPFYEKNISLNNENLNLMIKTYDSFKFNLDIKKGKLFNSVILQSEIFNKSIKYSTYALDASSSGLQILTLCLKNKNIGKKCGLILNDSGDLDIYTKVSNYLISYFDSLEQDDKSILILKKLPSLRNLISDRKFPKLPIMTIPYNSTSFGRIDQMEKIFFEDSFLKGILLCNEDIENSRKLFFMIDKVIITWCKKEIPECFSFIDMMKNFIYKDNFENKFITNNFIKFNYNLSLLTSIRRKIGMRKDIKSQKSKISVMYYKPWEKLTLKEKKKVKKKINNAFIANFIHSMDAYIAINVLNFFIEKNILIYSIHDCFRIDYNYATELKKVIHDSYIKLFEVDFLKKNNLVLSNIISDMNIDFLKKNFNYSNFVKE